MDAVVSLITIIIVGFVVVSLLTHGLNRNSE